MGSTQSTWDTFFHNILCMNAGSLSNFLKSPQPIKNVEGSLLSHPNKYCGTRTRASRAELHFPVGRMHRLLKAQCPSTGRVSLNAAVYLCAVLEYLSAEIFELSGSTSKDLKLKRISPRHIQIAIR